MPLALLCLRDAARDVVSGFESYENAAFSSEYGILGGNVFVCALCGWTRVQDSMGWDEEAVWVG